MTELTDEQTIAAADSLAHEISNMCMDQPMDVVMIALAGLVALGIRVRDKTLTPNDEEVIERHVSLVRFWIERQNEQPPEDEL